MFGMIVFKWMVGLGGRTKVILSHKNPGACGNECYHELPEGLVRPISAHLPQPCCKFVHSQLVEFQTKAFRANRVIPVQSPGIEFGAKR